MAKRGGKVGTMVLLLAGLWLGLAGSRCALALTVASRAGALKRLHAGALKLKASSKENADDVRTTAEAKWLQKTAEEIRQFGVDEVSSWVRAALEEENYADKAQNLTEILEQNDVRGSALLELTLDDMEKMGICMGPRKVLAKRIAAVSAPPTAASGFQDDPDATEFIRELANETPTDLGEGVQVFNLTKSLPAEPYDQSGPKLLTRNTTRRAWNATFEIMKGRIKRVAMLGVPGIGKSRNLALGLWHGVTGNLPEGFRQPEAIVYEAREGAAVFLFTKGQDGKWKAQRLPMSEWAADACPYLRDPNNWYLVDAFEEKPTNKFDAKTWLACSPERDHYSKFIKDGGCCVYIESWSKSELEAASCQIQSAPGCDMLKRYDKIGGNLRALLSAEAAFNTYVNHQKSEAKDWQHLQPAFSGSLDNQGKKLLTRLFTYVSKDAREYEVDFCCAGAAALVANAHYDKLVELWSKQDEPARYWFQKFVGPLLTSWFHKNFAAWTITNEGSADRASWRRKRCDDLKIAENLQLLECDSTTIFEDRWQKALQKATLSQQVLSSPAGYPGIDYLLEFNHGIQVTTAGKHNLALQFREKLKTMFNGTRHSFTLTFLTTGDPERFAPVGGDFNALRDMAGSEKLFDNVRVQVVQIPKTLNSLS